MTEKRIAIVIDTDYQSEGNYAYDTEEETRAAVEAEQSKLDSGEWSAYGVVIYRECEHGHGYEQCPKGCFGNVDAVWGVVTDSGHDGTYDSPEQIRDEFIRDHVKGMWESETA